jgi:hypothetical protein
VEESQDLGGDGGGAARGDPRLVEAQPAPEMDEQRGVGARPHLGERGRHRLARLLELDRARGDRDGGLRSLALRGVRLGGEPGGERGVHLLPDARHREEEMGPRRDQGLAQLLDGRAEVDAARGADGSPERDAALGDMRHGQIADRAPAGLRGDEALRRFLGPADLPVGENRALGRARGAGGVDVGRDRRRRDRAPSGLECGGAGSPHGLAAREPLVPADDPPGGARVAAEALRALEENEASHARDLRPDGEELLRLRGALRERQHRLRVRHDVGNLARGQALIERHRDAAGMGDAEVGDVVLLARARQEGDGLAGLEPVSHEGQRRPLHAAAVLAPGEGLPRAVPARVERGRVALGGHLGLEERADGLPGHRARDVRRLRPGRRHTRVARPAQKGSRSTRLISLPAASRGNWAWKETSRGAL